MVGLRRRLERGGKFIQPKSGIDLLETMEELSNPMGTFIGDVLILDKDSRVNKDELFVVYKRWATAKGLYVGNDLSFKRQFLAASQGTGIHTASDRVGGTSNYFYAGARLCDKAQKYIDGLGNFTEEIF